MRRPDDFHVHFRQGDIMTQVVLETADVFARAMVMPNTKPAIANGGQIEQYREQINKILASSIFPNNFEPLMTFKITPETAIGDVRSASSAGAIAGKLYPDGVTTGSEGGVRDFKALYEVFKEMSDSDLVLSLHGEVPDVFCLDREEMFLEVLGEIVDDFPDLKIVMEHLSTAAAVAAVISLPDTVAATITVHHLELTLDNVVGDMLNPHYFCKPLAKRPEDREALIRAVISGNPKFFFGSDSAPHPISKKECAEGCAGVYSAPVVLPVLVQIFEANDAPDKLEPFVSHYGADFYGLPRNEGTITLVKEPWEVRQVCSNLVPYRVGDILDWQVQQN